MTGAEGARAGCANEGDANAGDARAGMRQDKQLDFIDFVWRSAHECVQVRRHKWHTNGTQGGCVQGSDAAAALNMRFCRNRPEERGHTGSKCGG